MKLIANSGNDRVVDALRSALPGAGQLDVASPEFSLFAFSEIGDLLAGLEKCRMVLPSVKDGDLGLLGGDADRGARNRLEARALARACSEWLRVKAEVRGVPGALPQSALVACDGKAGTCRAITGNCALSLGGIGMAPGNQFGLIQCSESAAEGEMLAAWFNGLWNGLPANDAMRQALMDRLNELVAHKAPAQVYYLTLYHLFKDLGEELDEERIVKSATGIRNTVVWRKLFKFQRDGVIGALDKLERLGGCIVADSVGLGKTFEALAIIKYYELRNDRVLVLVPKRLRDNWTLYKANDKRNFLAGDRFH